MSGYYAEMHTEHYTWRAFDKTEKAAIDGIKSLWRNHPHTAKSIDIVEEYGIIVIPVYFGWKECV